MTEKQTYYVSMYGSKRIMQQERYCKTISGVEYEFTKTTLFRNANMLMSLTKDELSELTNCDDYYEYSLEDYDGTVECMWDGCDEWYTLITPKDTDFDIKKELSDGFGYMCSPEDLGWDLDDTDYIMVGPICIADEYE